MKYNAYGHWKVTIQRAIALRDLDDLIWSLENQPKYWERLIAERAAMELDNN